MSPKLRQRVLSLGISLFQPHGPMDVSAAIGRDSSAPSWIYLVAVVAGGVAAFALLS